jgi:hypothetical protein
MRWTYKRRCSDERLKGETVSRATEIEMYADEVAVLHARGALSDTSRRIAVEALVLSLSDDWVREDADAEDAVCSALESLGVMRRVGNLRFEIVNEAEMSRPDREIVRCCRVWLPRRYRACE